MCELKRNCAFYQARNLHSDQSVKPLLEDNLKKAVTSIRDKMNVKTMPTQRTKSFSQFTPEQMEKYGIVAVDKNLTQSSYFVCNLKAVGLADPFPDASINELTAEEERVVTESDRHLALNELIYPAKSY